MAYEYKFDDHKILTIAEEQELFINYHNAIDEDSKERYRNKIIIHNLKFAMQCAKAYYKRFSHVETADIKGYAIEGLIHAVDEYDYTRGTKFITYAVWWIKQFIVRKIQTNESMIRYPANWHQQLQQEINNKQFSNEMLDMCANMTGLKSLDSPSTISDSGTISDVIKDDTVQHTMDHMIEQEKYNNLTEILNTNLANDERTILYAMFGINREETTMSDIANELHINVDYARSLRNTAFSKIKTRKHLLGK